MTSNLPLLINESEEKVFEFYNNLNSDKTHYKSNDDICTPMECVKVMVDYLPDKFWSNKDLNILDACCGNGNFGAYTKFKTNIDNITFNDLNADRLSNLKSILNPKNIINKNILEIDEFNTWDLIIANPPYSGGGNKNRSISNQIIEHSVKLLRKDGYLCFITPNNWMTYNNNNTTLKMLLNEGSFLVIDNDAKKYFPQVGSSFTIFLWQKGVFDNETLVINKFLQKDVQKVFIPRDIPCIPLYISQTVIDIFQKCVKKELSGFNYRCDLHNFTQKNLLSDIQTAEFKFETIHTPNKTRFAKIKQDIYDKWTIIIPLSTYFIPYIKKNVNTTQSVGYFSFDTEEDAYNYLNILSSKWIKVVIHITRYGNFNNIKVLKHLNLNEKINFTENEVKEIDSLHSLIKY